MRTTVSISDELLVKAKRLARVRGVTLGQIIDAALRRELSPVTSDAARLAIPTFESGTGPRPGLDLSSNRALHEALDDGRSLSDLR